jgi:hypothetical protein
MISVGPGRVGVIFEAMKAKPNQTLLEGTVRAIRPDPGGYGSNVEIEVSGNLSPVADADFLKPQPGDRLTLFTAEAPSAEAGQRVRVQARLLGGPFGERRILEHLEVIEH